MTPTNRLRAAALALCTALGCSATDTRDEGTAGTGGESASGGKAGSTGAAGTGQSTGGGTGTGQAGNAAAGRGGTDGGTAGSQSNAGTGAAGSGVVAGAGGGSGGASCTVGGESFADGATHIAAADGCNTCVCEDGQLACTERACQSDECVLARRLDRCCPVYEAVTRAELAADECLTEEPGVAPSAMRAQDCFAKSPDNCAVVLCAATPPASRLVASNGAGDCSFVDECQSPADCVIGWDSRRCCACPESMPAALMDEHPCLVPEGSGPPSGTECPACDLPILCGQCEPPPAATTCVSGDALNRCE